MRKLIILLPFLVYSFFVFGQNQNLSNGNIFDGEPYLAINPNDSYHVVVAWMGWVNFANQFKIKTKTSFDGGNTWSDVTELPHTTPGYSSADPCVDFNSNGDVYISYIDFTGTNPPVTGGIYLCKSSDGGLTWGSPLEVINSSFDEDKWPIDRPWMVIDKSASIHQGNIYVTSFNLNRNQPSFNPYLSVSNDDGNSFSTKYLDTVGWLAGNLNPFPMCSPAISNTGTFYGIYPSFVLTQSFFFQSFLVSSNSGGLDLDHKLVLTQTSPASSINYPNAKKGGLLICNPSNENHLVFIFLGADFGDLDVFMSETYDGGINWSSAIRINDDPIANNRMQDLVWGDFDSDGDLIISWRDRRNGIDSTYQTASEIWASYRMSDSSSFSPNFQITNQAVAFDSVLENAGNDFMCIKLQDDVINASWGDTRSGFLNIWYQRMTLDGLVLSAQQISPPIDVNLEIFPNPTFSKVKILAEDMEVIGVYDFSGKNISTQKVDFGVKEIVVDLSKFKNGVYLIQVKTSAGIATKKIVKE